MTEKRLRFALFGNTYQTKKSASIRTLISCLTERGAALSVEQEFYDFLKMSQGISLPDADVITDDDFVADFVISMGGDGTFLKAASHVGAKEIPIVGINMGRLGFLAGVTPEHIEQEIAALCEGNYDTESRAVIEVTAEGGQLQGCPYALNDVAVLKRDNASMISIQVHINDEYLTTYQADGLVVSTPTGSTAYSLSVGGPIIEPMTGTLSLTAVAPHSLNVRPMVISDSSSVSLSVESRNHQFLIGIDGRSEMCHDHTRLTIRRAPFCVKVVKRTDKTFFQTLREKLMWGADIRQ